MPLLSLEGTNDSGYLILITINNISDSECKSALRESQGIVIFGSKLKLSYFNKGRVILNNHCVNIGINRFP